MEDLQRTFLLKEYDKLAAEIAKLLEETRTRERFSLVAIAGIAGWIYTEAFKPVKEPLKPNFALIHILGYFPLIIAVLLGTSVLFLYKNIGWIGQYLRDIEIEMYGMQEKKWGWERCFSNPKERRLFVRWSWVFWIFQVAMGLVILWMTQAVG